MVDYQTRPNPPIGAYEWIKEWKHEASGAYGVYDDFYRKDMENLYIPERSPVFPVVLFVSTWVRPQDAAEKIAKLQARIKEIDKIPLILVYAEATINILNKVADPSSVFGLPHAFTVASAPVRARDGESEAKLDVPTRILVADGAPSGWLRKPGNFVRRYLHEASAKRYPLVPPFSSDWYKNQKGGYTTSRGPGSVVDRGHKTGIAYPEGWFD